MATKDKITVTVRAKTPVQYGLDADSVRRHEPGAEFLLEERHLKQLLEVDAVEVVVAQETPAPAKK